MEVLGIRHGWSMRCGYKEGMCDGGEFKIYVDEDRLIVKQDMVVELIGVFLEDG